MCKFVGNGNKDTIPHKTLDGMHCNNNTKVLLLCSLLEEQLQVIKCIQLVMI